MKPVAALSPSLERMLLVGMARGDVPIDVVTKAELGREAQYLHLALGKLRKKGSKPVTLHAIATQAEEDGAEPEVIRPYVKKMAGVEPAAAEDILRNVRRRQALVDLMNEASRQLQESTFDPVALQRVSRIEDTDDEDHSLYSAKAEPEMRGPDLGSLKKLTRATGGLMGFWIIAGDPGAGKSTLALQIAAIAAGKHDWDVLYADAENSKTVMKLRLQQQLDRKSRNYKHAAKRIEYCDMRHFSARVVRFQQRVKPDNGLIVIDSLQKLPTRVDHKRESIESWLRQFEEWAQAGYVVLALSEKDRASYGTAGTKLGKETGETEYSAWVGIHMLGSRTEDEPIELRIVKNRHRAPKLWRGVSIELNRDDKRPFWLTEGKSMRREMDEEDE